MLKGLFTTLRACAAAALAAGAKAVYGLTLAQPPRRANPRLLNEIPEDMRADDMPWWQEEDKLD
jgi:hypothetical protein